MRAEPAEGLPVAPDVAHDVEEVPEEHDGEDHRDRPHAPERGSGEPGRVDLDIGRGEFVVLLGASGSGKSTLLNILGGLDVPTTGEVRIAGIAIDAPPATLALVSQDYGRTLMPWLRVGENVRLPLRGNGLARKVQNERVSDALAVVGLGGAARSYPWQLSGGMQQRVSIARALSFEPRILMMDEPFGALDEIVRDKLNEQLLRLWEKTQKTVVFVTHSIPEAVFLSDRVIVMSARPGRMAADLRIDLPRPRTVELRATEAFGKLNLELFRALTGKTGAGTTL